MKKIAWIKYCGPMELGYHLLGTQGNTDLRTSIFKEMLKQGIDLTNYSPMTMQTKKYMESLDLAAERGEGFEDDNMYLNQLQSKIATRVDEGTDLLVVECGPTNVTFNMSFAKGVQMSSVAYANQIISNFKGVVFYVHTDPALPITFFPEYYTINFTNESLKYGGFCNLQDRKTWAILTPALNASQVAPYFNGPRDSYKVLEDAGLLTVEHLEPHYGCLYDWGTFTAKFTPGYDLSYVGAERNRLAKFEKFMAKPGRKVQANLWGRWTDNTIKRYPTVHYHGQLPKGESRAIYNDSLATIVIADIMCEELGWITGRFFETVTAQSVPLVDVDLANSTNLKNILPPDLLKEITIRNHADVIVKLKKLRANPRYRLDLIKRLTTECQKFSATDTVKRMRQLWVKYTVKHKKRMLEPKLVRTTAIAAFNLIQRKRIADPTEFNKLLWETVNTLYYTRNVRAGKAPYMLDPGADTRAIVLPDGYRCYKCGTPHPPQPRTRFLCDDCKADPTGRAEVMQQNFDKMLKQLKPLNN